MNDNLPQTIYLQRDRITRDKKPNWSKSKINDDDIAYTRQSDELKDVTDLVEFDIAYDETLPLTKCVCGQEFLVWDFLVSTDRSLSNICHKCGRRFVFTEETKVFELRNDV